MEGLKAAYTVIRQVQDGYEEIIATPLQGKKSAQFAELQAMIVALERTEGKRVDSACVVGATQVEW